MYNKLFTKILDSSIWLENQPTRLVWITFLACMDQDGTVALSSIGNVANRARVSEKEAEDAIQCLESPDIHNPDQEQQGRRIERIPGVGWTVLNAAKYRDIIKAEEARAANRERVRRHRLKGQDDECNADVMECNDLVMQSEADHTQIQKNIVNVFEHWKKELNHPRSNLDAKRSKLIERRLKDFSTDDLKLAIDGCKKSAWHSGQNPERKVYDSISLILRDSEHVEQFIGYTQNCQPELTPEQQEELRRREEIKKARDLYRPSRA